MLNVAVGHGTGANAVEAVEVAMSRCVRALGDREPGAGILYVSSALDATQAVDTVLDRFPALMLVGCTTDGEMSGLGGYSDDGLTLTMFASEDVRFAAGIGHGAAANPAGCARQAVAAGLEALGVEPKLAITFPDGLTADATAVLDSMQKELGGDVPIVGGMSADEVSATKQQYQTRQFCGREVVDDSVPVLLLGGPIRVGLGVQSGWEPISAPMLVTDADDAKVRTLDDRPAFNSYRHYLGPGVGDDLSVLGLYPLAVSDPDSGRDYLRVASGADVETGEMTFLGAVPTGATARITFALRDEVLGGVRASVEEAIAGIAPARPEACLVFSCTGRRLALGGHVSREVVAVRDIVGEDVPIAGFYAFGEIAPLGRSGQSRFHNTTFVTVLVGSVRSEAAAD